MATFSKITQQQRKGYREVFIYYSKNGKKFRESTKVKIFDEGIVSVERVINVESNFINIRKTHREVEGLILRYIERHDEKPPVQWLRVEFDKLRVRSQLFPADDEEPILDMVVKAESPAGKSDPSLDCMHSTLFIHWEDFLSLKRQTTRTEGTIKRYQNLETTMKKFNIKYRAKGYALMNFTSLDQAFFNDLVYYMVKEHEHANSKIKADTPNLHLPVIGLSNETIIKRLTDLIEYLSFCRRRKSISVDMDEMRDCVKIAKHKLGVVKRCDSKRWELTLTAEELQFTINLDYFEPSFYKSLSDIQRRYLDIFVFMCLQGTAPVDTKKVRDTDIVRGKLVGDRRKTRNGFKVELDPISEQILIAHNYDLQFIDQAFNDAVKKMFVTIFELYRPYFEDKYDEEYQLIYTKRKSKGDEEFLLILHKGLFAEGMTGRRTFITNLNEQSDEVSVRENMRKTGHSRIQTHLGYQKDRQTGKEQNRRSLFGVSKINQVTSVQNSSLPRFRKRRQRVVLNKVIM